MRYADFRHLEGSGLATEQIRAVGIYGSPRKGGNSDTLLDAALDGAEKAGARIERLYLRDMNFLPCQNCGYCSAKGECRYKDDMVAVYEALDTSDIILLGAPIYFCSLCAQAKAMIDRCQPYWARKYVLKSDKGHRPGQIGGFVCCCGFKDDRFLACTEQIVKTLYYIMKVSYEGCCFVPGLDGRSDAEKHPTARSQALEYGKSLVERHHS
jgi:multimeric flavodoxin WrbA